MGPGRSGRTYSRVYGAATAKGSEHVRVMRRQDPLIIHAHQVQPVGGGGGASFSAVLRRENLRHLSRLQLSPSHLQQRPYDIPHHLLEKAVRLDLEADLVSEPLDRQT